MQHLGAGQLLRQSDITLKGLEKARTVIFHLHLGNTPPPLLDNFLRHILETEPGEQRDAQHQRGGYQHEPNSEAHKRLLSQPSCHEQYTPVLREYHTVSWCGLPALSGAGFSCRPVSSLSLGAIELLVDSLQALGSVAALPE